MTRTPEPVPRLTIGLPVYNGEQYLADALDAVLTQDYTDYELIICDNASTDRTPEIIAAYAGRDARIRSVRNESNIGGAANFNLPVELARGEYFKWASDDDLHAPTYLSACIAVLDAQPDVVLAYGKTTLIDGAGVLIRQHEDGMHLPSAKPWERLRDFAANRWLCNSCFGVMRTSVLRESTELMTPGYASDVTFLGQVALAGRVIEVPEYLFFRRITDDCHGAGEFSPDKETEWVGSTRKRVRAMPMTRVFFDLARWVLGSELSLTTKIHTLISFTYAWCKRQAGISAWRFRQRLRRSRTRSFAQAVSGTAAAE